MAAYFSSAHYTNFFEYHISLAAFEWLEVKAGATAGTWNNNTIPQMQKVRVVINEPPMFIYRNDNIDNGYNMHGMPGGITFYSPNEIKTFEFTNDSGYDDIGFTVYGEVPRTYNNWWYGSYRRENQFYAGFSISGVRAINGQKENTAINIKAADYKTSFDTDLNDIYINTTNMSEFVDSVTKLVFYIDLLPDSSGLFVRCVPYITSMSGDDMYNIYGRSGTSTNYNVMVSGDYSVDYLQGYEWAVLHYCMRWNPNARANNLTLALDVIGTSTANSQYELYKTAFGLSSIKTEMTSPVTFPSSIVKHTSGNLVYQYRVPGIAEPATNGYPSAVVAILLKHTARMTPGGGGQTMSWGPVGDYVITPLVNGTEQTNDVGQKYITARDIQVNPKIVLPGKQTSNSDFSPRNIYKGVHKVKAIHVGTQQVWPKMKDIVFSNPTVDNITTHDYFSPVEISIKQSSISALRLTTPTSSNFSGNSFPVTISGSLDFDSSATTPAAINLVVRFTLGYARGYQTGTATSRNGRIIVNTIGTFTPPSNATEYDSETVYFGVTIPINQTTHTQNFNPTQNFSSAVVYTACSNTLVLSRQCTLPYGYWERVNGYNIRRYVQWPIAISDVEIHGLRTTATGWTNNGSPNRYTTNASTHTVVYPSNYDHSDYYEDDVTVPVWTFDSTYNTHHRKIHARENGIVCRWAPIYSALFTEKVAASPAEPTHNKFAYMLNDHFYFAYGANGLPDEIPPYDAIQTITFNPGNLNPIPIMNYSKRCIWHNTDTPWATPMTDGYSPYDANNSLQISRLKYHISDGSWDTTYTARYAFTINDNNTINLSHTIQYNNTVPSNWYDYTDTSNGRFTRAWTVALIVKDLGSSSTTNWNGVGQMRGHRNANNFFSAYTITLEGNRQLRSGIADGNISSNNNSNIYINTSDVNNYIRINGNRTRLNNINFNGYPSFLTSVVSTNGVTMPKLTYTATTTYNAIGVELSTSLDVHLDNVNGVMLTASQDFGTKYVTFFIESTYVRHSRSNINNSQNYWAVSYTAEAIGTYELTTFVRQITYTWNRF